jgi:hypothetical protein
MERVAEIAMASSRARGPGNIVGKFVFSPGKRKLMLFDVATGPDGRAIIASFRPAEPCHAFRPMTKGFGLANVRGGVKIDQ